MSGPAPDAAVTAWTRDAEALASRLTVVARPGDVAAARALVARLPTEGLPLAWLTLAERLSEWAAAHGDHPLPVFRDWGALDAALLAPPAAAYAWAERADLR